MDELIRKQTVLNMIDNVQFGNITHKLSQLHEAVRNLPSAQQWIPCSERLPDIEQHLLVSVHDNSEFITIDIWTGTDFWTFGHHVIAWMPLPEPYREETES